MFEELTLLPCPACGGRAWVHYDPTTIRIYCNKEVLRILVNNAAVDVWNSQAKHEPK